MKRVEISQQILKQWRNFSLNQKRLIFGLLGLIILTLCLFMAQRSTLAPLTPVEGTSRSDIRALLQKRGIPFKERRDKFYVPLESKEILSTLIQEKASRSALRRGFEIFDSATWMKGEKEMQVLEMRALKEQLERDIAEFESIKKANVILDISSPLRHENHLSPANQASTKASIILTLMPGKRLSQTQLQAISNHLAGAVRGLRPHMIAISDTQGRLYQSIEAGESETLFLKQLLCEEYLSDKLEKMLKLFLSAERFLVSCKVILGSQAASQITFQGHSIEKIEMSLLIDSQVESTLKEEIQRSAELLLFPYRAVTALNIQSIALKMPEQIALVTLHKVNWLYFTATLFALLGLSFVLFFLYQRFLKRKLGREVAGVLRNIDTGREERVLNSLLQQLHTNTLTDFVKEEDPALVVTLLKELGQERAAKIMEGLPPARQAEVARAFAKK